MQRDKGQNFLRVFGILEYLGAADTPRPTPEIAEAMGIPQPSVYRLCQMLENEGLLARHLDGKRFILGPRMVRLARDVFAGAAIEIERRAILTRLVADVGETCNLAVPDKTTMVYADRVESSWPLQFQMGAGTTVPLHCTAVGKLYLSTLPARKRRTVLAKLDLTRHTDRTLHTIEALEAELERIRQDGHGIDTGEYLDGMVASSVPVHDPQGRFCAAIAIHGPEPRLTVDMAVAHLPRLRQAAAELEAVFAAETP